MLLAVREICIFMIIAQAVLFFVPGGSYMKYVRVLVGILMILRITEPILTFLADHQTGQEIQGRALALWDHMGQEGQGLSIEDRSIGIYQGIEEEIKTRLDQCQSGFTVKGVELLDEEGMVIVTVISRDDPKEIGNREEIYIDPVVLGENEAENESRQISQEEKAQDQELKELYSECVGISPEKIVIKYVGG